MPKLEEVFKMNGIPTHTYVQPDNFPNLLVSIRTPGRGVIVEGPSGIGKTTAVEKAIDQIYPGVSVLKLSARRPKDIEYIDYVLQNQDFGIAIIDDFHKLDNQRKSKYAEKMKLMADEEDVKNKIVIIGINKAGDTLISFAADLNNRLDIHRFEENRPEKIKEVVELGERALNIQIGIKEEIANSSFGSFYIAQMLCHQTCVRASIMETAEKPFKIHSSYEVISNDVLTRLARVFEQPTIHFARGNRFRAEGRAPYLKLLKILSESTEWSINLDDTMRSNPEIKNSLTQISEKDYLTELIRSDQEISRVIHYDAKSKILAVEDPQFVYYVKNIPWKTFAEKCGFVNIDIKAKRDFALSFAGADRDIANAIFELLTEYQREVFYDLNEQHRIVSENIEEYLTPIYQSEAAIVIAIIGIDYPNRIYTRIESKAFVDRIKNGDVVFVFVDGYRPSTFDSSKDIGYLSIDRTGDFTAQIQDIVDTVIDRMIHKYK